MSKFKEEKVLWEESFFFLLYAEGFWEVNEESM